MARITQDSTLTTRSARERLPVQHEPHWRGIESGLALGYRRTAAGGLWMARRRAGGRYQKVALGRADDVQRADEDVSDEGHIRAVMDFRQAQTAAIAWAAKQRRVESGLESDVRQGPIRPYTVADAMADYIADYTGRGGKAVGNTKTSVNAHILPALGDVAVSRLTRVRVRDWHRALASAPLRRRGKVVMPGRGNASPDPNAQRARQATANRVLTILKAALNHSREEGKVRCSADAWGLVRPFKGADAPRIRYLSDAEIGRLLNAAHGDFKTIVTAALLTGCRYGELAAMTAGAFNSDARALFIATSKSGKPRHVVLTDEGATFFRQQVAGKHPRDRLFTRDAMLKQATKDKQAEMTRVGWGTSHQFRMMQGTCKAANISPAISFHILRHTYASRLAANGASLQVIASQLGHAGTKMTERHYAHLAPSHVATEVRARLGLIGISDGNLVSFDRSRA